MTTLHIQLASASALALVDNDKEVGPLFAIDISPDISAVKAPHSASKAIFMIDVSLSSSPQKFNIWLELVQSILAADPQGLTEFAVLFFNIDQFWWREEFVQNTDLNRTLLAEYINTLVLEGATAHRFTPWQIESITLPQATDVLIAGDPSSIYPDQTLRIVGKGQLNANDTVKMVIKSNQKTVTLDIPIEQVLDSGLTSRAFGQVAVNQLEAYPQLRKTSGAFANYFTVPGRSSSLVMLESEADYKDFNIDPLAQLDVVKTTDVAQLLATTRQQMQSAPNSPKVVFKQLLKRLEDSTLVDFKPGSLLKQMVEQLPEAGFSATKSNLSSTLHQKSAIAESYLTHLYSGQLNYSQVSLEAQRRKNQGNHSDALVAFSSLVENAPTDTALLKDAAYKTLAWDLPKVSVSLFSQLIEQRFFEPNPYRDMALALAKAGFTDVAMLYFELLMTAQWQRPDFQQILAADYISVLTDALQKNTLVHLAGADLIVILGWNTDHSDVDLHVYEPSGELCFYGNEKTKSGGYITHDITRGYGPKIYTMQQATGGTYEIEVKYFAQNRNKASTKSQVSMTIIENLGLPNQRISKSLVTLKTDKTLLVVARVHRSE